MSQRIAVIGAGPSRLGSLARLRKRPRKGAVIPDIVCYERQKD